MSLTTSKAITLRGTSTVDGQPVLTFNSNVSTESANNGNFNYSIMSQSLYDSNKAEVRKDIAAFQNAVYEVEDSLNVSATNDDTTEKTPDDEQVNG